MALSQTSQFCSACNTTTVHQRGRFSAGWGVALTMITGGMFIPVWILIAITDAGRAYKCASCAFSLQPSPQQANSLPNHSLQANSLQANAAPRSRTEPTTRSPFPGQATRPGPRACPACTSVMPHTARFCRDCGTALAADLASV